MSGGAARTWGAGRGLGLVLVLLALSARLLVPVGFMPSAAGGFPLVICTGHGPAVLADGSGPQRPDDPGHPAKSDSPCVFAGHALWPTPIEAASLAPNAVVYLPPADLRRADLAPGRGLAAPPPPPRGPPQLL